MIVWRRGKLGGITLDCPKGIFQPENRGSNEKFTILTFGLSKYADNIFIICTDECDMPIPEEFENKAGADGSTSGGWGGGKAYGQESFALLRVCTSDKQNKTLLLFGRGRFRRFFKKQINARKHFPVLSPLKTAIQGLGFRLAIPFFQSQSDIRFSATRAIWSAQYHIPETWNVRGR